MQYTTLLLISLGLAMDTFAVSISNGLYYENFKKNKVIISSLTFAVFQGLMPSIGYFLGILFFNIISKLDHWIALVLLGYVGINMVLTATRNEKTENKSGNNYDTKTLLLQAFATSIDALAIGISFAALRINIFIATVFICCTTFICCIIGVTIGKNFGYLIHEKAKILGGIILIIIGLKIFIEHSLTL